MRPFVLPFLSRRPQESVADPPSPLLLLPAPSAFAGLDNTVGVSCSLCRLRQHLPPSRGPRGLWAKAGRPWLGSRWDPAGALPPAAGPGAESVPGSEERAVVVVVGVPHTRTRGEERYPEPEGRV